MTHSTHNQAERYQYFELLWRKQCRNNLEDNRKPDPILSTFNSPGHIFLLKAAEHISGHNKCRIEIN